MPITDPCSTGGPKAPEPNATAASAFCHPVTDTPSPCDTHTSTPCCTPMPPLHPQQPPAQPSPAAHRPRAPWAPPVHRQPWHLITHVEPPLPPTPARTAPSYLLTSTGPPLTPLQAHCHPPPIWTPLLIPGQFPQSLYPTLTQTHSGGDGTRATPCPCIDPLHPLDVLSPPYLQHLKGGHQRRRTSSGCAGCTEVLRGLQHSQHLILKPRRLFTLEDY